MKKSLRHAVAVFICALLSVGILQTVQAARINAVFRDVDAGTAAGRAVYAMTGAGYITGTGNGLFSPDAPIRAADLIRMLCLQKGVRPADTDFIGADAGYMQAALNLKWYDWDQIPPNDPQNFEKPVSRELGANIVVTAWFGPSVSYDYNVESAKVSDFAEVGGRYYLGVLGGLSMGIFDHAAGAPFYPHRNLTRGDACLWAWNAMRAASPSELPSDTPQMPADFPESPVTVPSPVAIGSGGVAENGWLEVNGTQLCSEDGRPVVLHGMSSHGIQWFPQYTNLRSIENTAARGARVFRVAMYVEEGGYLQNPALMKTRVEAAVAHAVKADMYVIIDWHVLQDGNPLTHVEEAAAFFREMSARYADTPNVLYEICNEPNGNITWSGNVKPYAERLVSVIRANSARGIILIGSPTWDQDVDQAAADPVTGTNLMYTLHFYAGTHHQELRNKADRAIRLGAPIFVSEWGTSAADGSGGVFIDSSDQWISWMKEKQISWCNWSLCDKNETSAALRPGTSADIIWTQADLSTSGAYVFARFADEQSGRPDVRTTVTAAEALGAFSLSAADWEIAKGNRVLSPEDIVSTGCTLRRTNDISRHRTILVMGDVLGTGRITIAQLVAVARILNGQSVLSDPYLAAAEFTGGAVNIADLVQEAYLLTGRRQMQLTLIQ